MQIISIKDIGKLVKETRKKQKLTQVQLAQLSNVGTRFLSDLENGKPTCEVEKTLKVLSNLGIRLMVQE
jgi:y4mF family transcriptional regulator